MKLDIPDEFTSGTIAFEFQTALHAAQNRADLLNGKLITEKSQFSQVFLQQFKFKPNIAFSRRASSLQQTPIMHLQIQDYSINIAFFFP